MPILVLRVILLILGVYFLITQITIPIMKETKLFPSFRRKEKVLDSLNVELNQELEYAEKISEINKKAEKLN